MNILAIDTATTALGLCLKVEAEIHTRILKAGLKHSEQLMPSIRTILQEAGLKVRDLDLIVCSTGPGSFTGIRIGLATGKGLAAGVRAAGVRAAEGGTPGKGARLIGVSTLDGLAHKYRRFAGTVLAVNPSLRKKYHAALYSDGQRIGDYLEITLEELCSTVQERRPLLVTGAGAGDLYDLLATATAAEAAEAPEAVIVDDSGQSCDPEGLLACGQAKLSEPEAEPLPLYLRKSEAEITFFGE
jgi:tRNA threonylcarbamoyladenosine biosynthesis protein TsaB